MNKDIEKTTEFVKEQFKADTTGHDWWHTERVWKTAKAIAKKESGNIFVIEMAALLHDIDDYKFSSVEEEAEKSKARKWLIKLDLDEDLTEKIISAVKTVSFKGEQNATAPETLEAKIVQDADRLDALGAIGIARTFAFGGVANRCLYDPEIKPIKYTSFEQYKQKDKTTTINHFYEKLLLIKDKLNTKTARNIAAKRHQFLLDFLDEFYCEWESKDLDEN